MSSIPPHLRKPAVWHTEPVAGVKKIIAIASGKGGVGKSTTAANLAVAFSATGFKTGLLDADIYGPSIPRIMALSGQPEIKDGKMVPLKNHGVECMSIGFVMGDQAAVLRGPMITKTLAQLLRSTAWDVDILLVDMPPGTGDIHLSLAQQAKLDGAIIVTTPQEVAISDARKCAIMFQKLNVPILGVIENMSGELFGHGGGKKLAEEFSVPFLGDIYAEIAIREAADSGQAYGGEQAASYIEIVRKLR